MMNTMETHIAFEEADCIPLEAEEEEVVGEEACQCSNMTKKKRELNTWKFGNHKEEDAGIQGK
jgi:hypothetical protein